MHALISIIKLRWFFFILVIFPFFSSSSVNAQGNIYAYQLYKTAGTSPELATGIVTDGSTNSYVLGEFNSPTTINGTTLNNFSGRQNIFAIKFKFGSTNAPQWVRSPVTDSTISSARISCDNNGNSYLVGSFCGTNLSFATTTITNNSSENTEDIFMAKYDSSGNFKLLTQAGGSASDTLGDLVTDNSGNCYLAGMFQSSTFSAGNSNLIRQSTNGGDCFTLKYNSSGSVVWIKQGSYARGECIALDVDNNCYVGGSILGSAIFDGLSPSNQISTNFLAKYTSAGTLVWVRGDMSVGKYIKLDKAQNIYTVGTFSNTAQFGAITLANPSASTVFVTKYDTNGSVLWAKQLQGLGNDNVTGLVIDGRTNCWVSCTFASTDSPTNTIAAFARFDQSGNLTGISQVGQAGTTSAGGVAVAPGFPAFLGGSVFICGSFASNFTLNGKSSLTNSGNMDVFASWIMVKPQLALTISNTNLVSAWPAADSLGFILETNSDLTLTNWTSAGAGSSANGQLFITNSISSEARFYRLRHP